MISRTRRMMLAVATGCLTALGTVPADGGKAPPAAAAPVAESPSRESAPPPGISDAQVQQLADDTGLTSAAVRGALGFLQEYKPIQAREFADGVKKNDPKVRSLLRDIANQMRQLEALKTSEPARHARQRQMLLLEGRADVLVERYQQAAEAQKPRVEGELTEVLGKIFDLRVEEERYQLELVRKRAEEMQARMEARQQNKDRIVDRQVTSRLGLDDILAW